jgi:hypothetical protein
VLLEVLRPLQVWRFVLMPLMLVFLMIYRPRGIMGCECVVHPGYELWQAPRRKDEEVADVAPTKKTSAIIFGVCAVSEFNLDLLPVARGHHRAERRRQDHRIQPDYRRLPRPKAASFNGIARGDAPQPDHKSWHRPHFPDVGYWWRRLAMHCCYHQVAYP